MIVAERGECAANRVPIDFRSGYHRPWLHTSDTNRILAPDWTVVGSFARIFYRNAVNIGLPVLICEEAVLASADGQEMEVDLARGIISNRATGQTFQAEPLDPFVARIVAAGGIIEYIRQEGTLR